MMDGGDHDPMELLNHPENIQNGLSFPDLQEDDVEDILSKLGMPAMDDPKWQRNIVGRSAVQESDGGGIDPFMVRYVELAKEMVSKGVEEQKIDPQLADDILSMLAGVEGTGGFDDKSREREQPAMDELSALVKEELKNIIRKQHK